MPSSAAQTLAAMRAFLDKCTRPILIESGEAEVPLLPGRYSLEESAGHVLIHAWPDERSYARRVMGIKRATVGKLELIVRRLGKPDGSILIVDAAYGKHSALAQRHRRDSSCEAFQMALSRRFPEWRIDEITTAPDLEHSLSPSFPRATLRRGTSRIAAIAAPEDCLQPDSVLSFGLIWLDYLRKRTRQPIESLALFVPEPVSRTTALRLQWIDPEAARVELNISGPDGEQRVDPKDWGNLTTALDRPGAVTVHRWGEPEADLEAALRQSVRSLDAALQSSPVYRQAPAMAGGDRGVMDLVAVDLHGRLAVLEIKVSPDIDLPLQALDYWMRVKWHLDRGDFARLGYFPGIELRREPPILYLVAPALQFHTSNETILRYFHPSIAVVRLGLAANWREELKVILRLDPLLGE